MIASTCVARIRMSVVSGQTVAYATNGASDFAIIEAKASAGGSVMLPASKPLRP